VRERFVIPESALPDALIRLKSMPGLHEGLIVSTCNRTEFYVTGEFQDSSAPVFFERFYRNLRNGDNSHLFRLWATQCVRHLFRVASGLESMVLGETEIFGQIKRAYEFAMGAKTTGKLLNRRPQLNKSHTLIAKSDVLAIRNVRFGARSTGEE
jgi:Glutamyl-tRNA reductase